MKDRLNTMIRAAKAAGRVILDEVGKTRVVKPDETGLHPHTSTDLHADAAIRKVLKEYPAVGILTEESLDSSDRLQMEDVFIVDPIDGTHSLLEGSHDAVVSIALARAGEIVEAVILNPFTGELWTAQKGGGSFLNGVRLSMPECNDLNRATFLMSNTEKRTGRLKPFDGRIRYTTRGSIAYKCALVATGQANGHFTVNHRSEWDIAAASLIVEEAGGVVRDKTGNIIKFNQKNPEINGVLCVAKGLLRPLMGLLKELDL